MMNERYVRLVGRTDDRDRVIVEVNLEPLSPGRHQTVTHAVVEGGLRLSIMGEVYRKGAHRGNPDRAGQIRESLSLVTSPEPGWSLDEIAELDQIWERWHLNDIRAACAHQTVVWEDSPSGRRPSLELTEPCPIIGYRYGSAWLTDPLPTTILERVRYLMRDRSEDLYRARGYDGNGKPVES